MFLSPFFDEQAGAFKISPDQASRFAKHIACDFNPIHDATAKRFCVPGDLLFALILTRQGLYKNMHFNFQGMVGKEAVIQLQPISSNIVQFQDNKGKTYLETHFDGEKITDTANLEAFIRSYVSFSGHNFIHILEPLMKKHKVMVNPTRPLIIYENMSFSLETLTFSNPEPKLSKSELTLDGKRGDVDLYFDIIDEGKLIGNGKKTLILSGLRAYEETGMKAMTNSYNESKNSYEQALAM